MPLTHGQQIFRDTLAQHTGLDRRLIGAWLLAEEGGQGGPASGYEKKGYYNLLNIARTDTNLNAPGSHGSYFDDPRKAAIATAQWIKGGGPITKSYGRAAPGIRRFGQMGGQPVDAQIHGLSDSGWASSHYGGGSVLRSLLKQRQGGAQNTATGAVPASPSATPRTTSRTITTPGVDNSAQRKQLLANYLLTRDDPNALLGLGAGLRQAQDVPGTSRVVTSPGSRPSQPAAAPGADPTAKFKAAANKINAQHLPYSWGGGHGSKTAPGAGVPLDCSGAVSSVLGINPRVSGDLTTFGSPGRAPGGRGVTIYANGHHTFMEIDGHFFGTSGTNPGGGAGWIPRSAISSAYLKGFTVRHLARSVH